MWAQFEIRQFDRLPTLAFAIEDDDGAPTTIDPATRAVTLVLTSQQFGTQFRRRAAITGSPTIVAYDWQEYDWYELPVGIYDLSAVITDLAGVGILTAPSRRDALVVVRPSVPIGPLPPPPERWDRDGRWDDLNIRWR